MKVRDAREAYFRDNGFSEAGYDACWVRVDLGPIPLGFPNTGARRRAVKLHDLHHVATGYDTTWTGEAEISAWELAAGCGRYVAAWILDVVGVAIGLVIAPRRTWQAWKRGRGSRSLYTAVVRYEALLDLEVEQLRRLLAVDGDSLVG